MVLTEAPPPPRTSVVSTLDSGRRTESVCVKSGPRASMHIWADVDYVCRGSRAPELFMARG
jgi:hypothetical protein